MNIFSFHDVAFNGLFVHLLDGGNRIHNTLNQVNHMLFLVLSLFNVHRISKINVNENWSLFHLFLGVVSFASSYQDMFFIQIIERLNTILLNVIRPTIDTQISVSNLGMRVSIFGRVFFEKGFNWASHLCLYLDVLFYVNFKV